MQRKICLALLTLSGGLMMVFAANVDKCTEKFEACKVTCGNVKAQCKASGSSPDTCESRFRGCIADCDKDLKTCQAKNPTKSVTPGPGKSPSKSPTKK
jgi:hypothetical protein